MPPQRRGRPLEDGGRPVAREGLTRLEQYELDRDRLRQKGYKALQLDLSAAGSRDIPFSGNTISIMRLAGTSPEVRVRTDSIEHDWNVVTSEGELRGPYDRVWLEWGAITNGLLDIRFATELY